MITNLNSQMRLRRGDLPPTSIASIDDGRCRGAPQQGLMAPSSSEIPDRRLQYPTPWDYGHRPVSFQHYRTDFRDVSLAAFTQGRADLFARHALLAQGRIKEAAFVNQKRRLELD
jgi:hypothetical protein